MEIKIKFTRDEVADMLKAKLKTMFPDQQFRVGQEYYGSPGWQAEAIQPLDDDAAPMKQPEPIPPPVDLDKLMAGDFDETLRAARAGAVASEDDKLF